MENRYRKKLDAQNNQLVASKTTIGKVFVYRCVA